MTPLLTIALTFPCVVYTVLLGAALAYWVFVMIGAARVEFGDGAAEGALDGLDAGADGHDLGDAGGDAGHHAGDGDAGDGHGDADGGDGDGHGGLSGMMAALKLRSVPATVVLSMIALFSWLFSVVGMQTAVQLLSPEHLGIARAVLFLVAPLLALPFTSLAVRPLARFFVQPRVAAREDLVGKVCTIRTGTVTDRFGEATLEDGGAGLVVRVRVDVGDGTEKLARGDHAVIVAYDEHSHEFTVAKLDDEVLDEPKRRSHR